MGARVKKTGTNKEGRENRQGENLRFLFCTIYQNKFQVNKTGGSLEWGEDDKDFSLGESFSKCFILFCPPTVIF